MGTKLRVYRIDMLDKWVVIHILSTMDQDGEKFHHSTWHGVQFKTYKFGLFLQFFHLITSDCWWTETMESKTANEAGGGNYGHTKKQGKQNQQPEDVSDNEEVV